MTDPHARRASGSSQAEPPRPLWRGIATLAAVAVMVITGAAWGKIGNIDPNIARFDLPGLFGNAGKPDDGAIDILMVGVDSRSDAHGNPLSQEELSMLRAGDETATNTDTIILIRIPNNGKSATAISIPATRTSPSPTAPRGRSTASTVRPRRTTDKSASSPAKRWRPPSASPWTPAVRR